MEKKFQVYKSSAGSGKTYTLVREYLKIVLTQEDPTRYRNILAITFTNKAANELKERILLNLKKLSSPDSSPNFDKTLFDDYKKEFNLDGGTLKKRALDVFESILHNYSDLRVSTIDKFTHKIIRAFSRDLGLNHDFDIEMDTDLLLKSAINEVISEAGVNSDLSKILVNTIEKQIENDKTWNIEKGLFDFSKELIKEENFPFLDKIRTYHIHDITSAKKELSSLQKDLEKSIKGKASEVIQLITNTGIDLSLFNRSTLPNYFLKIIDGEYTHTIEPTSKNLIKWLAGDDLNWLTKKGEDIESSLLSPIKPTILNLNKEIDELLGQYFLIELLYSNMNSLLLINFIYQKLELLKDEQGILLISDFNQIISEEIKDQPAPFIYEKIGERYKNIMIDEFQDTSVLQWQNLLPLIDNSLAFGNNNLLVGDAKQAIYRFRGGKVEQFVELPKIYNHQNDPLLLERQSALEYNYQKENLDTNWRSHSQVIEFNNWFFDNASKFLHDTFQVIYHDGSQNTVEHKQEGYVHTQFIDYKNTEDLNQDYLDYTLDYIKECLQDNFNYTDIAILVRGKKESILISDFLLENNIPVITSESLVIHKNPTVHFLVHFYKYIQSPQDNKAKIEILKFLFPDEDLNQIILENKSLDLEKILKSIGYNLTEIITLDVSIYDLTEHIIRTFNLKKADANPYLIQFLDKLQDFSKHQNDLGSFLDWWDKVGEKISISTPENMDAVSIMTIHKSKGLQFPVVICPFANWKFNPSNNPPQKWITLDNVTDNLDLFLLPLKKQLKKTPFSYLLDEEHQVEMLDNFNLLYVALTRPETRLYIISDNDTHNIKGELKDKKISSFIWEVISSNTDFNHDSLSLSIGKTKKIENNPKADANAENLININTTNWRKNVSLSETYRKDWDIKEYQKVMAYGNKIHLVLSLIKNTDDIQPVIEQLIEEGEIKKSEKTVFINEINEILSIPEVNNWFNSNGIIKNEEELITEEGKTLRPDKVIIENNRVILIDYKTGEHNPSYKKQLDEYAMALEKMNYKNIEKYILYTSLRKIQPIK